MLVGMNRKEYIHALQLNYDPFVHTSALYELEEFGSEFYNFFVEPEDGLLKRLREPHNTAVFALAGHGKTSLRLHLEASIRKMNNSILVVSYELEKAEDNVRKKLLKNIVVDLMIQSIENPGILNNIKNSTQLPLFAKFIKAAGLKRSFLQGEEQIPRWEQEGISVWWARWHRPTINKITTYSTNIQHFVTNLLSILRDMDDEDEAIELKLLFGFIRELGYTQIILSLECNHPADTSLQQNLMTIWEETRRDVSLKFFLPDTFRLPAELASVMEEIVIHWSKEKLLELIAQRLRTAGSNLRAEEAPHYFLGWYATPHLASYLEQELINLSQGSPRNLLSLVNRLLDNHCAFGQVDNLQLTADEWSLTKKQYSPYGERSMEDDISVTYLKQLFVGRGIELKIALEWCNGLRRLLVISGLPKIGKSWFIQHFREILINHHFNKVKVYYFDIYGYIKEGKIADLPQFIADFFLELAEDCPLITTSLRDFEKDYPPVLSQIGDWLHQAYPDLKNILIFDNVDELTKEGWLQFELKILDNLSRSEHLFFAITLRDPFRVNLYPLRFEETRLPLKDLAAEEGIEQLQKLLKQDISLPSNLIYTHPGINRFLYEEKFFYQQQPITEELIKKILKKLEIHLHTDKEIDQTIKWLEQIIEQLPEEWSQSDLESIWPDLSAAETQQRKSFLVAHWLIDPIQPPIYRIIPSLAVFLRDFIANKK